MHVISRRRLREFWTAHPDAEDPLKAWFSDAKKAEWTSFGEVRRKHPSADKVERFTVFNVGGNKYRLIVVIHYNRGKVYVREILTHAEYNSEKWKRH